MASSYPFIPTSLVAHIVVVGFHAKLGSQIEFSYPPLRGTVDLSTPKLANSTDIVGDTPRITPFPEQIQSHILLEKERKSMSLTIPRSPSLGILKSGNDPTITPTAISGLPPGKRKSSATKDNENSSFSLVGSISSSDADVLASSRYPANPSSDRMQESLGITSGIFTSMTSTNSESQLSSLMEGSSRTPTTKFSSLLRDNTHTTKQDWGMLPHSWSFLPVLALPDGAHDREDDIVYFCLPPDVHCVSCFQQISNDVNVVSFSAASKDKNQQDIAARGSIQKSVVLICRRPIYGVLADRLGGAVRAYFSQGDFAKTDVLIGLYKSINTFLARPSLNNVSTIFHGLNLRLLVRRLGENFLSIVKLIILEMRVVFFSQPILHSSNAVAAFASLFPGALDNLSPRLEPLDCTSEEIRYGFPLDLFNPNSLMLFEPYAPLPVLSELLRNPQQGCLIGTSKNVGTLITNHMKMMAQKSNANLGGPLVDTVESKDKPFKLKIFDPKKKSGSMPHVHALVNITSGQVLYAPGVKDLCALTLPEKRFALDLFTSVCDVEDDAEPPCHYVGSDDYIRSRVRNYICRFLGTMAAIPGVHPRLVATSDHKSISNLLDNDPRLIEVDLCMARSYHEPFVKEWISGTKNSRVWAKQVSSEVACVREPCKPELVTDWEKLPPQVLARIGKEKFILGFEELRNSFIDNYSDFSFAPSRAYESMIGFFSTIEKEFGRLESAIANAFPDVPVVDSIEEQVENTESENDPQMDKTVALQAIASAVYDGDLANSDSVGNETATMKQAKR